MKRRKEQRHREIFAGEMRKSQERMDKLHQSYYSLGESLWLAFGIFVILIIVIVIYALQIL